MSLDIFGFRALWSPYFFAAVTFLTIAYFLITVKWRGLFKASEPLKRKQGVLFITAMVLLYIIKGSPIDLMGHIVFYAHMIQMALLNLLIPPILILAVPEWLWKKLLSVTLVNRIFSLFTKPLIALILFNGTFSFYHMPIVFDSVKTNFWLHALFTTVLFMFAFFMWWPLINKLEEQSSISGLKKVAYVFASGALMTPACALIIFNDQPMYATYSDPALWLEAMALCVPSSTLAGLSQMGINGPEMFASISLLHDQQLGGVLMKVCQELIYAVILARVFYEWYRKDEEEAKEQQLSFLGPKTIE